MSPNAAFFTLHSALPRQGPGSREDLDWAIGRAAVPDAPRILDAGCGPGADIEGLLAHRPGASLLAVDAHAGFIDEVRARWSGDPRVDARVEDMRAVDGPFDLIWSAGALYSIGLEPALAAMFGKLAPGGALIFSEMCWITPTPDDALCAATRAIYPDIGSETALRDRIRAAGFVLDGQRILPPSSWEAYYGPLEARIAALRPGADAELGAVLDDAEAEIAYWRGNCRRFGYVLSVAMKPA